MAVADSMAAVEAVVFTVVVAEAFTQAAASMAAGADFVAAMVEDSAVDTVEDFAPAVAVGGVELDGAEAAGATDVAGAGDMDMALGGALGLTGPELTMATTDTPITILTTPTLPTTLLTRTTPRILAPQTARTIAEFQDTARHLSSRTRRPPDLDRLRRQRVAHFQTVRE